MNETCKQILAELNDKFSDCFNDFYTRSKCAESSYFVDQVRWEIGRIAFFDFDEYDITKAEVEELTKAFFAL